MMGRRWITLSMAVLAAGMLAAWLDRPAQGTDLAVNIGGALVSGQPVAVLVDVHGVTLYYLSSDTSSSSACTGACLTDHPAVVSDTVPPTASGLPDYGKLGVAQSGNGSQVTYDGHLLYRFSGDRYPNDVLGDGMKGPDGGVWHVATPGL